MEKERILIFCQAYPPDPAATGQYVADVARELASRGHEVEVLTASCGYDDASNRFPRREVLDGVRVTRLRWTSFGKKSPLRRIAGMGMFTARCAAHALSSRRASVVLATTSPPMGATAAAVVRLIRGTPFAYWSLDVNPDEMLAYLGQPQQNARTLLGRLLDWWEGGVLRRAACTMTADERMAARVRAKCDADIPPRVSPLWSHDDVLHPQAPEDTAFRRQHGLGGKFVVMYCGNHGVAAPLEGLLEAAMALRGEEDIRFVFAGNGVRKPKMLERLAQSDASNILMLPFQERARLSDMLCAGDVHASAIREDFVGVQHPCKLYNTMAIGRPMLLLGPSDAPGAEWVREGAGWRFEADAVEAIASKIRYLARNRGEVAIAGGVARAIAASRYRQQEGRGRVADAVLECVARATKPGDVRPASAGVRSS